MSERITIRDIAKLYGAGTPITMTTAYDYTFAALVSMAQIDIILVGDSLGTVVQGHPNTLSVSLDEMVYHTKMVSRGAKRPLVVSDLPFLTYQLGPRDALAAAGRMVKDGGAQAVKLEGGIPIVESVRRIVDAGIPVVGHVGLMPQSINTMGGYRVQGKTAESAERIFRDAVAIEKAGAFIIVLEGVPHDVAASITRELTIPTIGIGAGGSCSGQVLVLHDILGLTPTLDSKSPKFVKQYAQLSPLIIEAVKQFATEVRQGRFPGKEHSYC